jgi:hypothetical protein
VNETHRTPPAAVQLAEKCSCDEEQVKAVSEWLYPEATFLKWRFPQENATFHEG